MEHDQGIARTQSPTNKNCAFKWSTFETIVGVNRPEVQWDSLILEEPPSWSWLTSTPGKYAIMESILQNQWKSTNEMGWKFRKNLLVQSCLHDEVQVSLFAYPLQLCAVAI